MSAKKWKLTIPGVGERVIEAADEAQATRIAVAMADGAGREAPTASVVPRTMPSLMDRARIGAVRGATGTGELLMAGREALNSRTGFDPFDPSGKREEAYVAASEAAGAPLPDPRFGPSRIMPGDVTADWERDILGYGPTPDPQGLLERGAQAAGGAFGSAPTMMGGGLGNVATRGALARTAAGEVGSIIGQAVGGELGGVPGEMVGAMAAGPIAMRAVGGRAAAFDPAMRGALNDIRREYPEFSSMSDKELMRASSALRGRMPVGPDGDPDLYLREGVERLDDAAKYFPPGARPTTSQALGELGGSAFESDVSSLARGSQDFEAKLAGQKLSANRFLEGEFEKLRAFDGRDTSQVHSDLVASYAERRLAAAKAAEDAWREVPFTSIPKLATQKLTIAKQRILKGLPVADRASLPPEFASVDAIAEQFGKQVPLTEVQALRSRLLEVQRDAKRFGATRDDRNAARLAGQLLEPIEAMIDETEKRAAGVTKYRNALSATANYKQNFRDSVAERLMLEPKESKHFAGSLLALNQRERLRVLGSLDDAQRADVERIVVSHVLGDELGQVGLKTSLNQWRSNRAAIESVLGAARYSQGKRLIEYAQTANFGRAGTQAASQGTGSAVPSLPGTLARGIETITSPRASATTAALDWLHQTSGKSHIELMKMGLLDLEFGKLLLELPTQKGLAEWQSKATKMLAARGLARPTIMSPPVIGEDVTP